MNENIEHLRQVPIVEIVYGGGTIASLATGEGHRKGGHGLDLVSLLQEEIPYYKPPFEVGNKAVAYTGLSENMDAAYWSNIDLHVLAALNLWPSGVLLTHGTDSMEQTARHIHEVFKEELELSGAKIILTGANEDISHPATDAWNNLRLGLEAAADAEVSPGVYVAFHGKLIPANKVVRLSYVSPGDSTFVALDDPLYLAKEEEREAKDLALLGQLEAFYGKPAKDNGVLLYSVNKIRDNHNEFLEFIEKMDVSAVLLRLYHSGTANAEKPEQSIVELVKRLREKRGIVFFGVTENGEPLDLHSYETSVLLREAGVVPLYDMPEDTAFTKLQLIGNLHPTEIIKRMLNNQVGEISPDRIVQKDIDRLLALYSNT